jgi:hypothetical protein
MFRSPFRELTGKQSWWAARFSEPGHFYNKQELKKSKKGRKDLI